MDKLFIYMLFFTGIVLLVLQSLIKCEAKVEYRYLPRDLNLQMMEENNHEILKPMFDDEDVYLQSYSNNKLGKNSLNYIIKEVSY